MCDADGPFAILIVVVLYVLNTMFVKQYAFEILYNFVPVTFFETDRPIRSATAMLSLEVPQQGRNIESLQAPTGSIGLTHCRFT